MVIHLDLYVIKPPDRIDQGVCIVDLIFVEIITPVCIYCPYDIYLYPPLSIIGHIKNAFIIC